MPFSVDLSDYALTTLESAKLALQMSLSDATFDENLKDLINGATYLIEQQCQRIFVYGLPEIGPAADTFRRQTQQITLDQIEKSSGYRSRVYLYRNPIVEISSIEDPAGNQIDPADFVVFSEMGYLEGIFTTPFDSNGNIAYWTITYVAGYWEETEDVDPGLSRICNEAVASFFSRPDTEADSVSVGSLSITYRSQSGKALALPAGVIAKLGPWMDRVLA